jgi:hypothetical protein
VDSDKALHHIHAKGVLHENTNNKENSYMYMLFIRKIVVIPELFKIVVYKLPVSYDESDER